MLTKEEISKWAISAFSSDAAIVRAISGATWANEQNAAEIAVLKGSLVRHREEIARLEAKLSKYENRDSE